MILRFTTSQKTFAEKRERLFRVFEDHGGEFMGEPRPKIRSMPKTQDEIDLLSEDFE